MTLEKVAEKAPSVMTQEPIGTVSDRYTFVPTYRMIEDLGQLGWHPHAADEVQVRNKDGQGYQKHLVRFRSEQFGFQDLAPEIYLTNSHNGLSSFELNAGIFRFICANGMVVADSLFDKIRIRHMDYSLKDVESATEQFAHKVPKIIDAIDQYRTIEMVPETQMEFAEKALPLRWEMGAPIEASELLRVRRNPDKGDDLWSVYNRVQENLLRGGQLTIKAREDRRGRQHRVRSVRAISSLIKVNKGLWDLAEEYRN